MGSNDTPPEAAPDETGDASDMSDDHEAQSDAAPGDAGSDTGTFSDLSLPRRGLLGTLASLGLLGAASDSASAHHTEPKMSVSDSGTLILRYPDDLNFGENLSVTDDGDKHVTIDAGVSEDGNGDENGGDGNGDSDGGGDGDGASLWNDDDGDSLLEPTDGFEGIDTTGSSNGRVLTTTIRTAGDDFTLVTGTRATGDARNVVQGHASNAVQNGVVGGTIAGGGFDYEETTHPNEVFDHYCTIGGGRRNQAGTADGNGSTATVAGGESNTASGFRATVTGGFNNTASGAGATVGGGVDNTASGDDAIAGGGNHNEASADDATVGGGSSNTASGEGATIPGGVTNTADGNYSFAAGHAADTNGHAGAFVLADSSRTLIEAQNDDEVRSQMPMYAPSFNSTSARAAKTNVEPVDPAAVLAGVESLTVSTWEFTETDDGRHIGPMAADFNGTFPVGGDEETIASVDADGVALAAIQRLAEKHEAKGDRLEALEAENGRLRDELDAKDARIEDLAARVAALENKVKAGSASTDD